MSDDPGVARAPRNAALLALVAMGAHATALGGRFVWDDFSHVDHALGAPFDLREVFLPGTRFRPLLYLPGGLDAVVWGERAAGWHLTTLLLHAACAAVLYLLLRRLLASRAGAEPAAIAGAALFALHPATSEVAAWIMARGDSLSLLLGMLAAHAAMSRRPITMAALLLGSVLAKETGVAWLVLAPACASTRKGQESRFAAVGIGIGCVVAAGAYGAMRFFALRGAGGAPPSLSFSPEALLGATGFYARAALLPFHYRPFVEDVPVSASFVIAGVVAVLASIGAVVVAARRRSAVGGLAIAGVWLALLPAILTAGNPVSSNAVADRHLYAALPWLVLAGAIAWEGMHRGAPSPRPLPVGRGSPGAAPVGRGSPGALLLLAVVLAGCAGLSMARDRVWHDERSLWRAVLRDAPESRYAWGNLGLAAASDGNLEEAERAFRGAQASRDPHPFLRVDTGAQLAMLLTADGRLDEARAVLDGLRGVPTDADGREAALRAEALLALAKGDPRGARIDAAIRGSATRRRDPVAAWHLARVLENRGDRAGAADAFTLAESLAGAASRGLAREAIARRTRLVTEP